MFDVSSNLATVMAAFFAAGALVPILAVPARRVGLLDEPCRRKRHHGSIPLTGGLAMFFAAALAMIMSGVNTIDFTTLAIGMAVLLAKGIVDDLFDTRALYKLVVQTAVASFAVIWGGLDIGQLGYLFGESYGAVGLGPFSAVFSIVCIVFLINVINMADGLDGLAGGMGFLIFSLLALTAWLAGSPDALVTISLVMAAVVAGFLFWNMRFPFRHRASAFMGDAGSMMLGFAAAWLAIAIATTPAETRVYPVLMAWILLIPSMDTVAITIRRLSQGRNPMAPDRAHLHHIVQRCGLSVTATVGLIHLGMLASGLAGIWLWQSGVPETFLFLIAALAFVTYTLLLFNARGVLRWSLRIRRS